MSPRNHGLKGDGSTYLGPHKVFFFLGGDGITMSSRPSAIKVIQNTHRWQYDFQISHLFTDFCLNLCFKTNGNDESDRSECSSTSEIRLEKFRVHRICLPLEQCHLSSHSKSDSLHRYSYGSRSWKSTASFATLRLSATVGNEECPRLLATLTTNETVMTVPFWNSKRTMVSWNSWM